MEYTDFLRDRVAAMALILKSGGLWEKPLDVYDCKDRLELRYDGRPVVTYWPTRMHMHQNAAWAAFHIDEVVPPEHARFVTTELLPYHIVEVERERDRWLIAELVGGRVEYFSQCLN